MTKLVVVAACAWLAACSGKGEGDPPQLSPLLGGPDPGASGGASGGGDVAPGGGGDVVPGGGGDVVPGGGGDVVPGDGEGEQRENLPPELVSLEAEQPAVAVGGSTALTARVRDAEDDRFYLWWDASCGIVSATESGRAIFLAPSEPGTCTVTLQVQDAELQRTREYTYDVQVLAAAGLEDLDD